MTGWIVIGLIVFGGVASYFLLTRAYAQTYSENHRDRWDDDVKDYLEEDKHNG